MQYADGAGCSVYSGVQVSSPSLSALNGLLQLLSDVDSPQNQTLVIIDSLTEILHGNTVSLHAFTVIQPFIFYIGQYFTLFVSPACVAADTRVLATGHLEW